MALVPVATEAPSQPDATWRHRLRASWNTNFNATFSLSPAPVLTEAGSLVPEVSRLPRPSLVRGQGQLGPCRDPVEREDVQESRRAGHPLRRRRGRPFRFMHISCSAAAETMVEEPPFHGARLFSHRMRDPPHRQKSLHGVGTPWEDQNNDPLQALAPARGVRRRLLVVARTRGAFRRRLALELLCLPGGAAENPAG